MISSMHIIGSQESGGAERFFMRLVRALHRRGEPVLAVSRASSAVARELGSAVPQAHAPLLNVFDVYSMWKIRRLVAAHQPDVVQTYMGRATRLTHLSRNRATAHVARLGGFYKVAGYRHADAWIGNTKDICDYLRSNGFASDRIHYIPNFVELAEPLHNAQRTQIQARYGIASDAWVVLGVGRLVNKKGFADLLTALARMPGDVGGRAVHLLIAGDGSQRAALQAQAAQLGIAQRVHWAGWQSDPSPLYAAADLFVCPSLHEPLGNVILEAWAHGLPVVSTETHGAKELIVDGDSGILVPCAQPAALAAAITAQLQAEPAVRAALGAAGRQVVASRYSEDAVVSAYLDLYARLRAR